MADIEQDLKNNIAEFIKNGDDGLEKQRYNAAVDAYFKAIVILCDLKVFQLRRLLPKHRALSVPQDALQRHLQNR